MRAEQEKAEAQEAQWRRSTLERERAALTEAVPEWRNEEKMGAEMRDIIQYARDQGFPDEELQDVTFARHVVTLRKAMLYDQGKTVADRKVKQPPKMQRASNGRFVKQKGSKVQKLIERAQQAKGSNKREAQADAVAALLMGE